MLGKSPALITSSHHFTGHPSNCNKARKRKGITRKKVKLPLFITAVLIYVENPKILYVTITRTNHCIQQNHKIEEYIHINYIFRYKQQIIGNKELQAIYNSTLKHKILENKFSKIGIQ